MKVFLVFVTLAVVYFGGCGYLGNKYVASKIAVKTVDKRILGRVVRVEYLEGKRVSADMTLVTLGSGKRLDLQGEVKNLEPNNYYDIEYRVVTIGNGVANPYNEFVAAKKIPTNTD